MKKNELLFALIIVVLCFISYSNIIANDFVWDDEKFIVDRPNTRTFKASLNSFAEDEYGIYRPVRTISYYLAYKLFGLNAPLYHFFSIILHSSVSVLIFFIIKKLFDKKLALLSAMLFAVHPIHIGRVTNATGSFDIIGIIFYLLAFYCYIIFRQDSRKGFFYASTAIFIIGLFSSEEIFTLPLMIILYEIIFHKKIAIKSLSYFVPLGAFIIFRSFVVKIVKRVSEYPGGSLSAAMLTMPKVLITYILLIFFPFGLTPFRRIDIIYNVFNLWFILPLIAIIYFIYFILRQPRKKIFFFSGWFLITLLPFLNILPLQKIMAERYFYLASLSVLVFIAEIFIFLEKKFKSKLPYLFFGLLIIFFIGSTIYNNGFWKDEFTLMSRGISLNPYSSKAHNNLGSYYFRANDYDSAVLHYRKAIANEADNYQAWSNLGVAYSVKKEYMKSIEAFEKAIDITPYNYEAYDKLGITYMDIGSNKKAEEMFKMALYFEEDYYPALSHLGTLYGNMGNNSLAAMYLQKAVQINPYYAEAYFNIGLLYESIGKDKEARAFFIKAVELDPSNEYYASKVK